MYGLTTVYRDDFMRKAARRDDVDLSWTWNRQKACRGRWKRATTTLHPSSPMPLPVHLITEYSTGCAVNCSLVTMLLPPRYSLIVDTC